MPCWVQALWQRLGWSAQTWGSGPNPPSNYMDWGHLDEGQREAALALGYTAGSWDAEDGNPFEHSTQITAAVLVGALLASVPVFAWLDNRKWRHVECDATQRAELRAVLVRCEKNVVVHSGAYTAADYSTAADQYLSEVLRVFNTVAGGGARLSRAQWLVHEKHASAETRAVCGAVFSSFCGAGVLARAAGWDDSLSFQGFATLAILNAASRQGDTDAQACTD
jgi:hypothetical protein